jgi:hypothetical protein
MKGNLERLGVIVASYSRPRISDNNPFPEALFRIFKYRPNWPTLGFASKDDPQRWVARRTRLYIKACVANPRGGHATPETGRWSATSASTLSATPAIARSETRTDPAPDSFFDKHRSNRS